MRRDSLSSFSGRLTLAAGSLVLLVAVAGGCQSQPKTANSAPSPDPLTEGKKLVAVLGCNDCHTPMKMGAQGPEPDMDRFLIGHPQEIGPLSPPALSIESGWMWAGNATNTAYAGPWGISYAANLTPDIETGLGAWTEELFIQSIRSGKHMGTGRPIMPPMPWMAYANLEDKDLKLVFAYLKTLPATKNEVPPYSPPGE